MITLAYWQVALLVALVGAVSFFFGISVMAWVAMAHYDGDEQRSEPE